MSGFGNSFDRAQRAYDAQMPPEEPPPVENECERCGGIFETDKLEKHCKTCQKEIDNE